LNERFRSAEAVEAVELDFKPYTYLYESGDMLTFMDKETFEQIEIAKDFVGERAAFLQDGMEVKVESYEGRPISVKLPLNVTLQVVEADPVVKGQTAASSYKPAKLENGLRVMVPPFIETGTRIVVATEDTSYVKRAE
jgi:elongation factor P